MSGQDAPPLCKGGVSCPEIGLDPSNPPHLLSVPLAQSVSALNATKRDLAEFVTVLGSDTKTAVSGATTSIQGLLQTVGAIA